MLRNALLIALIPVGLFISGCVDMTQQGQAVVMVPKSGITFLLIDNSLSYNNLADEDSQRILNMVKEQITKVLREARPGEHILVRTIQSESNQLSAFLTHLDLDDDEFYFLKPKPTNPIEQKVWEKEKREFEATVDGKMQTRVDAAIAEFDTRGREVFSKPSQRTDFVGALLACQRFFSKEAYDSKNMVIYSDMIEDAALEDDSLLDLSGVKVQAKFVTKPVSEGSRETHRYYINLEKKWRHKLKTDQFQLYEVQNSF